MKNIVIILAIFLCLNVAFSQNYKSDFDKYSKENNTTKQIEILKKWEEKEPTNPELFTSYFNYFLRKSREELVSITKNQPKGESLVLEDSTGKLAGYIGSEITYEKKFIKKAIEKIDQGILLHPNRLDMRFGKIYILGEIEDWQNFSDEIIKTIKYSKINNNEWTWTNNEKGEYNKDFLLGSVQDYQKTLFNTEKDELLLYMRLIAEEILKIYPNHIESLSNISITYLIKGDYDKGIEVLLKALEINPKDGVILRNIGQGYKLKGDKANAIKIYEKMLVLDDQDSIDFAKEQIEMLKKK